MSREEFIEYLQDPTKEVTPVMFFYYKLKGGTANKAAFEFAFMRWMAHRSLTMSSIIFSVFNNLKQHFKID